MTAWTAFYWDDYLGDTQDLSLVEHGAYIKLLAAYYAGNGRLSADPSRLYRICSAFDSDEQAAVDAIVARYFGSQAGELTHERADREIGRANAKSEAARKANAVRWQSDRNPTGVRTDVRPDSSPQPHPQSEEQPHPTTTASTDRVDSGNGSAGTPTPSTLDKGEGCARSKSRSAHGARLPDDWMLTAARLQEARRQGLGDAQAQREADKFADHWRAQPGQKGRKSDWEATWRNWCRRAAEQTSRARPGAQQNAETAQQWAQDRAAKVGDSNA